MRTAVSPGGEEPPARGVKTQLGTFSERVSERDGGFVVGTGRRGKCEVLPSRQPHGASGKEGTSSCWKQPSLPLRPLFSRRRELAMPQHVGKPRGGCPSGTRCFHPCFSPALPLRRAPRAREPCMCTKMCASSARAARLGSGVSKRLFSERFLEGRCDEQFKAQADRINQARPVAAFGRRWISPRGSDDTCC